MVPVLDPVAQHVYRAALADLTLQPRQELAARRAILAEAQRFGSLGLGGAQEGGELHEIDAVLAVVVLGIAAAIAAGILIWKNWATIVDFMKEGVNDLIDVLNFLIKVFFKLNPLLFALESFGIITAPEIPNFAHGGTQRRSGLALVGERGPELVNLPAGAQVAPISPTVNNFNITANYTNPQDPQTIRLDLEAIALSVGG